MIQETQFKRLKIGIVLSSVPGYSETFFRNKIKGLQDNGFEVVLFADYAPKNDSHFPCKIIAADDFNGNAIKVFKNSCRMLFNAFFKHPRRSFRLYQLDKKDRIGLNKRLKSIILNQFLLQESLDWLHFGFGMLASGRENVAEAIDAKMAVSFRGYDLYLSPLKHPGCYDLLFKKKVRYHVLSEGMKQTLKDYHINEDHIQVITPAIDTQFFSPQMKTVPKDNTIINIVTVARLHWKKGLEYTLEALAKIKQKQIKFKYTIIGEGEEQERLVFAAHQLGISDEICFAGKLSPMEVREKLENSSIYLQYSIQEGFCNAVLEAQSMGLLCIVSNAEGLDENVLDEITGWVVPKRQPEVLVQKIIAVMQMSKAEQQAITTHAISRVKETFNLERQNRLFKEFYQG